MAVDLKVGLTTFIIFPAGKEAWHGGGIPHPGTRWRARGRSVEHSCSDLQFWKGPGQDQEKPHPQSGWFQRGELPLRWPAWLARFSMHRAQWVFLPGKFCVRSCYIMQHWNTVWMQGSGASPHSPASHEWIGFRGTLGEPKTPLAQRFIIFFNITWFGFLKFFFEVSSL